ncbi:hypothetical protein [Peribacillus asahii]|uniref:hypothetical protein n=1 Tax=Peribacillus asahii TaxID=228899 RepID=UPI00380A6601
MSNYNMRDELGNQLTNEDAEKIYSQMIITRLMDMGYEEVEELAPSTSENDYAYYLFTATNEDSDDLEITVKRKGETIYIEDRMANEEVETDWVERGRKSLK